MSGILMMSVGNSYGYRPINTVAPAVTGTVVVGQTLSTTNGTWDAAPASISYTYQWQRNTSNIGGATSSTYVIQTADIGNTLRCVVTATNAVGAASANSNSTSQVPPLIGSAYGGGYFAGQISTSGNGVATHNLVVAPRSTGQSELRWKTSDTSTAGTSSTIDGPTNSANMNNASHPAAQFCEGLTIGGFSDWYMPARNELEVLYFNLKPSTESNDTSTGANPNAVPARGSNYTSGTPAQTTATLFIANGGQDFTQSQYWASTEFSSTNGWRKDFGNGLQTGAFAEKTNSYRVRAVRRIAV